MTKYTCNNQPTEYPQWRKDRCEHCAAGVPMSTTEPAKHWISGRRLTTWSPCTAPTEAEYIAKLEDDVKALKIELEWTREESLYWARKHAGVSA